MDFILVLPEHYDVETQDLVNLPLRVLRRKCVWGFQEKTRDFKNLKRDTLVHVNSSTLVLKGFG